MPLATHVQAVLLEKAAHHYVLMAPKGVVDEVLPALGSKHPGGHVPAAHRKAPAVDQSQDSVHTCTHAITGRMVEWSVAHLESSVQSTQVVWSYGP